MARVRANGVQRWVDRASQATGAYQDGVNNPRKDWEAATKASETNWQAGVNQAITNKMFSKGVTKAGNEKWKQQALNKGAARYPSGVMAGQSAYQSGIAPYIQVIEGLTLPPRLQKGDPRNFDRVSTVANALRAKKVKG